MKKTDLFEYIQAICALIRADKHKTCTELRLQLIHVEVLDYLSYSNQFTDTPAAAAAYFGMTRGTVSQSLIVLEKKGYIEKNRDTFDKRIIHVQLLPPGQAILKKAHRSTLFNNATWVLNQKTTKSIHKKYFKSILNALQKASLSPSFSNRKETKFLSMKEPSVFDLIEYISTLIRSEERKRCTDQKIQLVHAQILTFLSTCNKHSDTPAAVANYLGLTRGTVSQTLIVLEKKEFIKKTQDNKDKRVYHIVLLDKGRNTLEKIKLTKLYQKASKLLEPSIKEDEDFFVEVLTMLQKANNSYSFGICKTCKNFTKTSSGFFCELTQEKLRKSDSELICQEHMVY